MPAHCTRAGSLWKASVAVAGNTHGVCSSQGIAVGLLCNWLNDIVHSHQKWSFTIYVMMCFVLIFACIISEEHLFLDKINVNEYNQAWQSYQTFQLLEISWENIIPPPLSPPQFQIKYFKNSQVEDLLLLVASTAGLRLVMQQKRQWSVCPTKVGLTKQ